MKNPIAKVADAASKTPNTDAQIAKGDWSPLWDTLRQWDPEFIEAYLRFRNVPHRKGPLSPKFKELILIAVNASTTHLYAPGIRRHIQNAIKLGATREEILEVLELVTVLGIHACNMGVPILADELAASKAGKR
jgi:alkylhydroperoxidase/carboxymuconolactone decarboxylase family protein YurZ